MKKQFNKNKAPVTRIPLSAAIKKLAGAEGLPQPVNGSISPVAAAELNPPSIPSPSVGGAPPQMLHHGTNKVTHAGKYLVSKNEIHESPGGKKTTIKKSGIIELNVGDTITATGESDLPPSSLPDGKNSPDSLIRRDGRKRFGW